MHKHYTVDQWQAFASANPGILEYVAVSAGTSEEDFEKISAILAVVDVPFICLDVANGYSEYVRIFNISICSIFTFLRNFITFF
jgi:GMP reductase